LEIFRIRSVNKEVISRYSLVYQFFKFNTEKILNYDQEQDCEHCREYNFKDCPVKILRDVPCVFSWNTQLVSGTALNQDVNTVVDKSLAPRQKLSK
jgi:hypothetical protein